MNLIQVSSVISLTISTGLVLIPPSLGQQVTTIPSNIGIDIVFPRNDTYHPVDPFPIVFAFQGATAAWNYGFFFEWRTRQAENCEGECGVVDSGQLAVQQGDPTSGASFGEDDYYFFVSSSRGLSRAGNLAYNLEWDFGFQRNCSASDGGSAQSIGTISASNIVGFRTQADANPDVRQQAKSCPIQGGIVGIQADLSGCPQLGETGIKTDPCVIEVPNDVVNQVAQDFETGGTTTPSTPPSGTTEVSGQTSTGSTGTMSSVSGETAEPTGGSSTSTTTTTSTTSTSTMSSTSSVSTTPRGENEGSNVKSIFSDVLVYAILVVMGMRIYY